MPNLPQQFLSTGEGAIASYSFQNIITGEGIATYFLGVGATSTTAQDYILSGTALITTRPLGILEETNAIPETIFEFRTQDFNSPSTIKGTAYFAGYVKDTVSNFTLKATLYKESGTLSFDGAGDIEWNEATEETFNNTGAYVLDKTISGINDYVNKTTAELKIENGSDTCYLYPQFLYLDSTTGDANAQTTTSGSYVVKTYANPNLNKKVASIRYYRKVSGNNGFFRNLNVYEENVSGVTTTTIAAEVISATLQEVGGILLNLPITSTNISIGERIMLKMGLGGEGQVVVDPTNEHNTEETAKINIPFRIDI